MDTGRAQQVAHQPANLRQGHQDDLRRSAQGQGPRRRHRLSQLAERQSEAADREGLAAGGGGYFRQKLVVDDKSDQTPVTVADREAEAAMRRLIEARFPEHGIYGEEQGRVRGEAEYVWVLDPIDGTKSFISGIPLFGTL